MDSAESRFGPVLLEGAGRLVLEHRGAGLATLDEALGAVARLWRPAEVDEVVGFFDAWGEPVTGGIRRAASMAWTNERLSLLPTRAGAFRLVVPPGASLPASWCLVDADGVERVAKTTVREDGVWVSLAQAATSIELSRTSSIAARLELVVGVPWWVGAWDPRADEVLRFGATIGSWRQANRAAFDDMVAELQAAGWRRP